MCVQCKKGRPKRVKFSGIVGNCRELWRVWGVMGNYVAHWRHRTPIVAPMMKLLSSPKEFLIDVTKGSGDNVIMACLGGKDREYRE